MEEEVQTWQGCSLGNAAGQLSSESQYSVFEIGLIMLNPPYNTAYVYIRADHGQKWAKLKVAPT